MTREAKRSLVRPSSVNSAFTNLYPRLKLLQLLFISVEFRLVSEKLSIIP